MVYDLPDMQPLPGGSWIIEKTANEPKLVLKRRTPTIGGTVPLQAVSWINPCPYIGIVDEEWPDDTQDSSYPPSGPIHLEIYQMKSVPAGNPFDTTLPLKIPVYKGACVDFMGPSTVGRWPCHPSMMTMWCGQKHLIWRVAPLSDPEGRIAFAAVPLPSSTSSQPVDMKAVTVFYKPPCRPDPDFVLLCPSSGRVVTIVGATFEAPLDESHLRSEIQVADYLLPPSCF